MRRNPYHKRTTWYSNSFSRMRIKKLVTFRTLSTIKNTAGVVVSSKMTDSDVRSQTMSDMVTKPWPPQAYVRKTMYRQGLRTETFPPIAPMNVLSSTLSESYEPVGIQTYRSRHTVTGVKTLVATTTGNLTQIAPQKYGFAGGVWPGSFATLPSINLAEQKSQLRARTVAFFDRPTASFGEPAGELRSTLQFLRHPLRVLSRKVGKYYRDFRRLKRTTQHQFDALTRAKYLRMIPKRFRHLYSRATVGDAALLWAAHSFVISPTVRTINDAVSIMQNSIVRKGTLQRFSSIKEIQVPHMTTSGIAVGGELSTSFGWERIIDRKYFLVAGILTFRKDVADFSSQVGGRARDIPVTAWELSPLSFIVDRVLDTKNVLRAATSLTSLNVKQLGGYETEYTTTTQKRRITMCYTPVFNFLERTYSPLYTPYWTQTTIQWDRTKWRPVIADALGGQSSGLLSSLTKTLDVLSIIQLRLGVK
jgi:hypothetical protein